MSKKAIILINTGSPDNYSVRAVRRYLHEFLNDSRVITLPTLARKILVDGIIVPFRAPRSAKLYKKIWQEKGSPLIVYSQLLKDKLQNIVQADVFLGMRYGNPSLRDALSKIQSIGYQEIVLFPLYPQYASSTWGSAVAFAFKEIQTWNLIPKITTIGPFYNNELYLNCVADGIKKCQPEKFDHIIFSYHGLPLSHVKASHQGKECSEMNCQSEITPANAFCYQAHCYATTHSLVKKSGIEQTNYTLAYQSRFSRNWLFPFTDEVIREKARMGLKRILVVSPSFVTDCLETIYEIGTEYKELFLSHGGEHFEWVSSMNVDDNWIAAIAKMIAGETITWSDANY